MTRGKPLILSRQAGSQARENRKREAESAFNAGGLPYTPPAELRDAPAGRAAWRALLRAHSRLPGELYNRLDRGFMVNYCLAVESRARALTLEKKMTEAYWSGQTYLENLLKVRVELRQSIRLCADLEKQLYATPKSRGGVTPPAKEQEPVDELEMLLDEVNDFLDFDQEETGP